jgi:glycosyltransferase involved in cell wall biosynthesis
MPAFNEEEGIETAVLKTHDAFQKTGLDFEIIVINDDSKDETGVIADRLDSRFENIQVIHHDRNRGCGAAFKTGIRYATKDYIIFVPIDNPLDTEDIDAYLPRMNVCDIIVGVRIERTGYSRFARFASFVYNRIFIPLLFNIGVEDVNWIQVYRRDLFTSNLIDFQSTSLFWLVEILIRAKQKQLIIAEVPSKMKRRIYGKSTCVKTVVILQTFFEMIKFFFLIRKEKK